LPLHSGAGDMTKANSFVCVADENHNDNQPSAPKYVDDGDNYPIALITPTGNHDHGHDRDDRCGVILGHAWWKPAVLGPNGCF